jgi:hypothetical protein
VTRERSPNYPQIGLDVAVESVRALFKRESRSLVPLEVAVKAWGYSSLNGVSRVRIASLRQYGLLLLQDGKVRVSPRGVTIAMLGEASSEYQQAIKDAALTPPIFRDLYEAMGNASDENLTHFLVNERKFSPDGARRLVRAYRATVEFAKLTEPSYDDEESDDFGQEQDVQGTINAPAPRAVHVGGSATSGSHAAGPTGSSAAEQYRWPLVGGVVAEVTFRGGQVTTAALAMLNEYLGIAQRALAAEEQASAPRAAAIEQEQIPALAPPGPDADTPGDPTPPPVRPEWASVFQAARRNTQ